MRAILQNSKFKLVAGVVAFFAFFGIIDALPKHKSQPKKLVPVMLMHRKNGKLVPYELKPSTGGKKTAHQGEKP